MRAIIAAALFLSICAAAGTVKKPAMKLGIKTPGVQIPFESLKALAEIPVAGTPGEILVTDAVWVMNSGKDSVEKIDGKTNKPGEALTKLHKPCSGLATGFGSLLIPNCGDQSLVRADAKTGKVSATLSFGAANVNSAVAVNADSIWMLTDRKAATACALAKRPFGSHVQVRIKCSASIPRPTSSSTELRCPASRTRSLLEKTRSGCFVSRMGRSNGSIRRQTR
jgi:DNA-binding beta-propeller fold protein YncE